MNNKQVLYNGLQSDMNTFAKFVYIYEKQIKLQSKADDINIISQQAGYLFKTMQKKMKYLTKKEIKEQRFSACYTLYFTKYKVQWVDYCRHLRNSFVHGNLKINGNELYIADKNRNNATCTGYLEYGLVKKFVVQIINGYEQNCSSNA